LSQLKEFRRRLLVVLLILVCCSQKTSAVNYYWVGGTGNWNDLTHWATTSGGTIFQNQIPTALDDVYFDANSFTAPGQIVTLDVLTVLARSMNWTGVTNTPSLNGGNATLIKLYGSVTLVAGMNFNVATNISLEATTTGQTIKMGGKSFGGNVTFNGIGGGWTLVDAFSTNGTIT